MKVATDINNEIHISQINNTFRSFYIIYKKYLYSISQAKALNGEKDQMGTKQYYRPWESSASCIEY